MNKKEFIEYCLTKGFLISPDFSFEGDLDHLLEKFSSQTDVSISPIVLYKDLSVFLENPLPNITINWHEFEKSRVSLESGRDSKVYSTFLTILQPSLLREQETFTPSIDETLPSKESVIEKEDVGSVVVLKSYQGKSKKREVQDFVKYYSLRFDSIRKLLLKRQELANAVSIYRILSKGEDNNVSFIGMVSHKSYTQKGNILLTLEDVSGEIKVVINKNRKEVFDLARDVVLDEVIGIHGTYRDKMAFGNNLFFPDIPVDKELTKVDEEVYAVFTADMHTGSYLFYREDFLKFIDWINGENGNEQQKNIAKKVKYLFFVGDIVDGVGIYPRQERELTIQDIYEQYQTFADLIKKIRKDVSIIICGGNHDALRLAEPQPPLDKEFAKPIWEMPNTILVTNPSLVSIHAQRDFAGFKVLLYHGYSFPYFADHVESIRANGGNLRADLVMKYLLQRRHLAPSHGSTLIIPDNEKDPMVIEEIPDFFVTGHMHRTAAFNYRNVSAIGCSCWVGRTSFMEKVGIYPDPSRITLVNLQTREMKILKFGE